MSKTSLWARELIGQTRDVRLMSGVGAAVADVAADRRLQETAFFHLSEVLSRMPLGVQRR